MRKYILFAVLFTSALRINSISSCPCGFSPDDKRPFFEQYEVETNTSIQEEKE
jgi:hypothetical protein